MKISKYKKINNKILLHKKGKNWIVLSIGILAMVLGGFSLQQNNVHANINSQSQQLVQTQTVSSQANNLHKKLVNNAVKQNQPNHTMKLGANRGSALANNNSRRYNYLKKYENSDNHVFLSKPYTDDTGDQVSDGKINPTYSQHVIDWMNYVRGLYNVPPISHSNNLDTIAQSALINNGNGYSYPSEHVDFELPTVDNGKYQEATYSDSDFANRYYTPSDLVMNQFNKGNRLMLLDPDITTMGIGYSYEGGVTEFVYNRTSMPSKNKIYFTPTPGLSPYKISNKVNMKNSFWDITVPDSITSDTVTLDISDVKVHDDTAHKNVPLNPTDTTFKKYPVDIDDDGGYTFFMSFEIYPKKSYIEPNHVYTLTWRNKRLPHGKVSYRTKLYATNSSSHKISKVNKYRNRKHKARVIKNKRNHSRNNRRHTRIHRIRNKKNHRKSIKRHTQRNRKNRHKVNKSRRHGNHYGHHRKR